jgi:hypothetical protein
MGLQQCLRAINHWRSSRSAIKVMLRSVAPDPVASFRKGGTHKKTAHFLYPQEHCKNVFRKNCANDGLGNSKNAIINVKLTLLVSFSDTKDETLIHKWKNKQ